MQYNPDTEIEYIMKIDRKKEFHNLWRDLKIRFTLWIMAGLGTVTLAVV